MTTERPELYIILGILSHATQAEISRAYRSPSRHHPVTRAPANQSQSALSDAALQQVVAAYTMLHDLPAEPTRISKSGPVHIQHPSERSRR